MRNGSELDPATMALLGAGDDVDVVEVPEADAFQTLLADGADCAVLPLGDHTDRVFALLEQAAGDERLRELPLIVYTPHPLGAAERTRLDELSGHVNAKTVSSPERLVDETALFLHRMEANLPAATRKLLVQLRTADSVFHGKRILIVDDDIRNVFALTSALEMRGMKVLYAENGREGIGKLRENPEVDLVLLDVMMPEMDGYETARSIRGDGPLRAPADHLADGQGDEGRPREVHRRRRVGLHHEAGRHGPAAVADAGVAAGDGC